MCYGQILESSFRKARKAHRCGQCGKLIQPKETYYVQVQARGDGFEDSLNRWKLCAKCWVYWQAFWILDDRNTDCPLIEDIENEIRDFVLELGGSIVQSAMRQAKAKLRERTK